MFDFLITCRIYGNSKLLSGNLKLVFDVEVVFRWKDTSTRHWKTCNKAIYPQSPIKCARKVKIFLPMVFQMISPVRVKTCAWNSLLAGEFMILIPSITVSRFAQPTYVFLKDLRYYTTVGRGSKRHSLFWLKRLGQWFSTLFVPRPIVANHYNPTTPSKLG